jgi:hypothetical protein
VATNLGAAGAAAAAAGSVMTRPDPNKTLAILKDFQRDTVEHVFERMYESQSPATRFLVADEVGLGKTMVARGIVAKVIDRLWETVPRIDIVYICSNSGIARQNINRLNVTGTKNHPLPDRITLLPRDMKNLQQNRVNFISFTPGTSFNLGDGQGKASERALLFQLLPADWLTNRAGAVSVLTGWAGRSGFEERVDSFHRWYDVDATLKESFQKGLAQQEAQSPDASQALRNRFLKLADQLGRREKNLTPEEINERKAIVGTLRNLLAAKCVESLEPDLVILDEFQRFKDLLRATDEASNLARQLFDFPDARVLMLSATPYKMFTMGDEASGDDHYRDFVETISFLQRDELRTSRFKDHLQTYRRELFRIGWDDGSSLRDARSAVEAELKHVMVRTERLAVTPDRSGMLKEVPATVALQDSDVSSFLDLKRVARAINYSDVTEFWKSAPYVLNFMDDYLLKQQFKAEVEKKSAHLTDAVRASNSLLLRPEDIDAYRRIDPANARLRALEADTIDREMWRVLWMPPSLPYYRVGGPFADAPPDLTKRLVFSAWQVVPKVVSALITYEAERRMLSVPADGAAGSHQRTNTQLLRFGVVDNRATGMPVLGLLYPCLTLATEIDPLRLMTEAKTLDSIEAVRRIVTEKCRELLAPLDESIEGGPPDDAWHWAAPLLLDRHYRGRENDVWLGQANLAARWRGLEESESEEIDVDSDRAWTEHVEKARDVVNGKVALGAMPADLPNVLADLALGGPAVCALRAITRTVGGPERMSDRDVRNAAGTAADGIRSLFNQREVLAMLRSDAEPTSYWRRVLDYSVDGCLQAVLDEYAHVLVESCGLVARPWRERAKQIGIEMRDALQLRTANVLADTVYCAENTEVFVGDKLRFRSRFAVRYGSRQRDDGGQAERETDVRRSFNSPFWPFVLCSTSVGQEGLDFHTYCHAVVHWNLPSNPVDLEQREGRVHRFKGHAVRKNIAKAFASKLWHSDEPIRDPWSTLFDIGRTRREESESDLVPYWVFSTEDGSKIERHIPALPLSRDVTKAEQLRKSLAVYRMAFGQSRQEEMVAYLLGKVDAAQLDKASEQLTIKLAPQRGQWPAIAVEPDDVAVEELETIVTEDIGLGALTSLLDEFARSRPPQRTAMDAQGIATLLDDFKMVTQGVTT